MPDGRSEMDRVRAWHRRQLGIFVGMRPRLEAAAVQLRALLGKLADEVAPGAMVEVRVKSLSSVSEKILRGGNPWRWPTPMAVDRGLVDLVAGRIVPLTRADRDGVCRLIERLGAPTSMPGAGADRLEIDWSNSVDSESRLLPDQFGYTARHFVVRTHGRSLFGVPIESVSDCGRWVEIQVVPAISNAWSEIVHDRAYKADLTLPASLRRRVAEAKALVDSAEQQLEASIVELDRYRRRHAGRLWAARGGGDVLSEYDKAVLAAEGVLVIDLPQGDDSLDRSRLEALELRGELAMSAGDWMVAIECFSKAAPHRARLKIRLAEAYQHAGRTEEAVDLLDAALQEDPSHLAAACARAELVLEQVPLGEERFDLAVQILEKPFLATPDEPEALLSYCTARLLRDRDAARLCTMQGAVKAAIEECLKREALGSDMPECLLQHARLALLAGRVFDAVNMYCYASVCGSTPERLRQERQLVELLRARVDADATEPLVGRIRTGLECAGALLELLTWRRGDGSGPPTAANPSPTRFHGGESHPITMIVGACGSMDDAARAAVRDLLDTAFLGLRGTILSGGTTSGISGVVGEIVARSTDESTGRRRLRAVGYLPDAAAVSSSGDQIDDRYDLLIHVTAVEPGLPAYSPLAPIRAWADLLGAGLAAEEIRVLGIGGGIVSDFEYRLALAIGARVGIVSVDGLGAADIVTDTRWSGCAELCRLIPDGDTIRFFVVPLLMGRSGVGPFDERVVHLVARVLHGDYRRAQLETPDSVHPSVLPWDLLDDAYRSSSIQQARTLQSILAHEGFSIVPESDPRQAIRLGVPDQERPGRLRPNPEFEAELDRMARLEHARWNAERFAMGWTHGPVRDPAAKTSPHLVPFDDLPRDVQGHDYMPFLNMNALLEAARESGKPSLKVVRSVVAVPEARSSRATEP
jgi:ppGpp synthetase/RelA/SpoT-type nucleotidyltranferase